MTLLDKDERQIICLEMIEDYPKDSQKIALAAGTYSSILKTLEVERILKENEGHRFHLTENEAPKSREYYRSRRKRKD